MMTRIFVSAISMDSETTIVKDIGSSATLLCSVKTSDTTTLQWYKDSKTVISGKSSYDSGTSNLAS